MGDLLTVYPFFLKNTRDNCGFRLNVLKGSVIAFKVSFIGSKVCVLTGLGRSDFFISLFSVFPEILGRFIAHVFFNQIFKITGLEDGFRLPGNHQHISHYSSRFFRVRRGGLASVLGAGSSACALGRSHRGQPSGPPSLWQRWPASMDGQRGISGF